MKLKKFVLRFVFEVCVCVCEGMEHSMQFLYNWLLSYVPWGHEPFQRTDWRRKMHLSNSEFFLIVITRVMRTAFWTSVLVQFTSFATVVGSSAWF